MDFKFATVLLGLVFGSFVIYSDNGELRGKLVVLDYRIELLNDKIHTLEQTLVDLTESYYLEQ